MTLLLLHKKSVKTTYYKSSSDKFILNSKIKTNFGGTGPNQAISAIDKRNQDNDQGFGKNHGA